MDGYLVPTFYTLTAFPALASDFQAGHLCLMCTCSSCIHVVFLTSLTFGKPEPLQVSLRGVMPTTYLGIVFD